VHAALSFTCVRPEREVALVRWQVLALLALLVQKYKY